MRRGEIWWANLPEPSGSAPGYRRPVIIISSNEFIDSAIDTIIVAAMTGNLYRAAAPGNFSVPSSQSGLPRNSVVNVAHLMTVDRQVVDEFVSYLPSRYLDRLDDGLRRVLSL